MKKTATLFNYLFDNEQDITYKLIQNDKSVSVDTKAVLSVIIPSKIESTRSWKINNFTTNKYPQLHIELGKNVVLEITNNKTLKSVPIKK